MVESRWFRRAGPAVAALGAIALIASTTLGAPDRILGAGSVRRRGARRRTRRPGRGIGSTRRCGTARASASGWPSVEPASVGPERSGSRPSRSPPARSAARSWSEAMTARVRSCRSSTWLGPAPGSSASRPRSSARPRSRRTARRCSSIASIGGRAPISASGAGRWMARPHRIASCRRSCPTSGSGLPGSPISPGATTVGRWRCSPARRSPVASGSSIPTAAPPGSWPTRPWATWSGSAATDWSRTAPAAGSPARSCRWTSTAARRSPSISRPDRPC